MAESSTNSFGSPLPVVRVHNLDASIAYYLDALGFELRWRAGDGFACVAREECSCASAILERPAIFWW
jgi:hypothetical protein